jgi:phospholipase/carboxylesterase
MPDAPDLLRQGADPARAKAVCVFLHGRGQTPEEMADQVLSRLTAQDVSFLLPRAPGKSWYKAKAVDPLTDATRDELAASLDQLRPVVTQARASGRPVLLAGFSQGACLSLEYAMRAGPWNGALAALTGARVGQAGDARPRAALAAMPVYLTGGDADPWIPVSAWAEAAAELASSGAVLRAEVFPGRAHVVSDAEIAVLDAMLARLTDHRAA